MADRNWNWRDKSAQPKSDGWREKNQRTGSDNWRSKDDTQFRAFGSKTVQNHFQKRATDSKGGEKYAAASNDKFHRLEKNQNESENIQPVEPMPMPKLLKVLQISDDVERILALSSEQDGFLVLLEQQDIPKSSMFLILTALAKVSESSSEKCTVELLVYFYVKIIPKLSSESNFYREMKLYIADWGKHIVEDSVNRRAHITAVQNLLIFLQRLQGAIRQKSSDAVRNLMQLIEVQIEFINLKGHSLDETIVEILSNLNATADSLKQMQIEKKRTEVLLEPPEDFRAIGIYPDTYDILSDHRPFIRPSKVEGEYVAGVDQYLDIQFRLLREDFIRSLREGIGEYRRCQKTPEASSTTKNHVNDLNVYRNVRIVGSTLYNIELLYSCEFDWTLLRKVRWEVGLSFN